MSLIKDTMKREKRQGLERVQYDNQEKDKRKRMITFFFLFMKRDGVRVNSPLLLAYAQSGDSTASSPKQTSPLEVDVRGIRGGLIPRSPD